MHERLPTSPESSSQANVPSIDPSSSQTGPTDVDNVGIDPLELGNDSLDPALDGSLERQPKSSQDGSGSSVANDVSDGSDAGPSADLQSSEVPPHEVAPQRNFIVMALYQIVVRAGWIFKTESIIIPAVMDAIGGTPLMRGILPVLNRFGHSIPPVLFASRLNTIPKKQWALGVLTFIMGICFLLLAFIWIVAGSNSVVWLPYAFLAIYGVFFVTTGLNNLVFNTLQGKLIRFASRGRQMLVANTVGAIVAILLAWFLLPNWLTVDGGRFEWIFGFAGCCFVASSLVALLIVEPRDSHVEPPFRLSRVVSHAFTAIRSDRNFRLTAIAAFAFGSSFMLFPHYQALARESLGLNFTHIMTWVVVQNAGTAVFSIMAGMMADGRGNRLALRTVTLLVVGAPTLAIGLHLIGPDAKNWFSCVFLLVGLTPVAMKLFTNYVLELVPRIEHARYVSIIGFCISAPILIFSPIVGWLIGEIGFAPVFGAIVLVLLAGWLITFLLDEPRNKQLPAHSGDAGKPN